MKNQKEREGEGTNPKLFSDHLSLAAAAAAAAAIRTEAAAAAAAAAALLVLSLPLCSFLPCFSLSLSFSSRSVFAVFSLPSKPLRSKIHQVHILFFLI